jgi:hypothetical protein
MHGPLQRQIEKELVKAKQHRVKMEARARRRSDRAIRRRIDVAEHRRRQLEIRRLLQKLADACRRLSEILSDDV